jgi:acyl-CoA thioester hydrolase
MFKTKLSVRGYELDSYGHVNNAVYLQYLEQARWEIMKKLKVLEYLKKHELLLVVAEIRIRYMMETTLFDELIIESDFIPEPPYLIFNQKIRNRKNKRLVTKAQVKTIFINKKRIAQGIPPIFHQNQE